MTKTVVPTFKLVEAKEEIWTDAEAMEAFRKQLTSLNGQVLRALKAVRSRVLHEKLEVLNQLELTIALGKLNIIIITINNVTGSEEYNREYVTYMVNYYVNAFQTLQAVIDDNPDRWASYFTSEDKGAGIKKLMPTKEMWTSEEGMAAFGHRLMEAGDSILTLFNEFKDKEFEDDIKGTTHLSMMVTLQEMNHITSALYDGLSLSDFDVLSTKASIKLFNHKVDLLDTLSENL